MSEHSEALLELANRIEEANGNPIAIAPQAATELRRQHDEIETLKAERDELREEVQKWQQSFAGHLYVKTEDYAELVAKRDALTNALQDRLRELKAERDAAREDHLRVRDECFANMAAYRDIKAERDALLAERDALREEVQKWQPIETAPEMRKIIVHYLNALGKHRCVMACYYLANSLEMHDDFYYASVEDSDGYAPEGWYEEHDQDSPLMPIAEEPTHWMPLPAPPSEAKP